jgi:hypothetical protein
VTTTDNRPSAPDTKRPRPWYRKKRHIAWMAAVTLIVVVTLGGNDTTTPPDPAPPAAVEQPAAPKPAPEPVPEPEPEPEPEPPVVDEPDPTVMQVGDGFIFTQDGTEAGSIVIEQLERTTRPYESDYGSGPKRNVFLLFTVRVEATASTDVYEDDFYVVTGDGERVDHGDGNSYDAVDMDDMLGWAELNAGQHTTGVLVFDSPVKHGTLAYDPNYEGEPIATWEF